MYFGVSTAMGCHIWKWCTATLWIQRMSIIAYFFTTILLILKNSYVRCLVGFMDIVKIVYTLNSVKFLQSYSYSLWIICYKQNKWFCVTSPIPLSSIRSRHLGCNQSLYSCFMTLNIVGIPYHLFLYLPCICMYWQYILDKLFYNRWGIIQEMDSLRNQKAHQLLRRESAAIGECTDIRKVVLHRLWILQLD